MKIEEAAWVHQRTERAARERVKYELRDGFADKGRLEIQSCENLKTP